MSKLVKKVCIVGSEGVGKTSLVRRFVDNEFDDNYLTTIGAKISQKNIQLENNNEVELILWDLAGFTFERESPQGYFMGASGFIVVGDLSRQETLSGILKIYQEYLGKYHEKCFFKFVLNKSDLVSLEEGFKCEKMLKNELGNDSSVFLTSAKVGRGVEELFLNIAKGVNDEYNK